MKCTSEEWDHCRVEKMGCPGCYYNENKLEEAIEMTNNIADMAIYNYVPNNKNEMVLKGKPTYILGDKGRTAIKTILQALEDKEKLINEMAAYIANLDIDEDICKKVKIQPCINKFEVSISCCIECIKKYFKENEGESK